MARVNGEYRIIDGHRRNAANILNLERGHKEYEKVLYRFMDMSEAMYELRLLAGNGYTQELTAYEKTRLVERTKAALIRAKEEDGLEIQGKMRDLVAAMINESSTNVARMDAINNNATPEIKEQLKEGNLGITAAYEAAKLDEDEQKEIAEKAAAGENVRAKEIAEKVAEKKAEDFRDCYAVGGIDLSQTTDLTAASVVIQKDGTLYAFTQFFMPRGRLEYLQATDGVPYDIFVKKGLITLSGENYVDYHDVYGWFTMLLEDYGIRPLKIGYDRYSAQYLITDMANYGFHMDDVYQGENLTPVIREFEGIIKDGDFKIADNNLLKTHFLNVALKHNMETRKFRPIKIEQRAHIDGFVSVIDAMTVRQKYWEECGELLKNAA